jgi:alpha-L-fucosidase 2
MRLYWPTPATRWYEGLPVGNGRLGAMIYGDAPRTTVALTDSTVWSGTPSSPATALADVLAGGAGPDRLAGVRAALRAGDHYRAERLLLSFQGRYSQEFLPCATLTVTCAAATSAYERSLDLDAGVAEERFHIGSQAVRRRTWASAVDGVVCVEISSTDPTDVSLELGSPLRVVESRVADDGVRLGLLVPVDGAPRHEPAVDPPLVYSEAAIDGYDPYAAVTMRLDTDGTVTDQLDVTGLTRLFVTIATATSAEAFWTGDPQPSRAELAALADGRAAGAATLGVAELLRRHTADQRSLLAACRLTIGARPERVDVPTLLRTGDPELMATVLFQLGRYLLVASSREQAGPPANLQGIWNADLRPPWSSNYTVNINTEMNYWAAEPTGLPTVHGPLLDFVGRLQQPGSEVARQLYGCRGWVAHHNTDPWGWALPVGMGHGSPSWANWAMGGAWLVQHVWDHWDFGRDRAFLAERAWPLLRGCAEFLLDWLVEGDCGRLDTLPSTSPENLFLDLDGGEWSVTRSAISDIALIRATFERTLAAAEILGLDDPVCAEIRAALPRLHPPVISSGGWLQEWADDLPEEDPRHRHVSQLVTVYPLGQIDPLTTPELASAASVLLDRRGPGGMGWSWAWKIALRARLGDGDTAAMLLAEASRPLAGDPEVDAPHDGSRWGGLLPNLLSTHPPFQIDANLGFPAAIVELLVQSHGGVLRLLPALPQSWPDGAVDGVRCRGGLTVSLRWAAGRLAAATIQRMAGDDAAPVRVRTDGREIELHVPRGETVTVPAHPTADPYGRVPSRSGGTS